MSYFVKYSLSKVTENGGRVGIPLVLELTELPLLLCKVTLSIAVSEIRALPPLPFVEGKGNLSLCLAAGAGQRLSET